MKILEQYQKIKNDLAKQGTYGILFFRLGDFYEAFFDDAEKVREFFLNEDKEKSYVGYSNRKNLPMYGVLFSKQDKLKKLVSAGYNVLIKDEEEVVAF